MNKEYKDKWVAALRSGEYKQHRHGSNDNLHERTPGGVTARCCLNVGAHVVFGADADRMITVVCKANLGLSSDASDRLINMNDKEGKNFNEIADWIEANL